MTRHVFVIEDDPEAITVVDPAIHKVVATIKAGEKMEYPVGDDAGAIYVAGEEKGDLLKIDARTDGVVSRWPAPGCIPRTERKSGTQLRRRRFEIQDVVRQGLSVRL